MGLMGPKGETVTIIHFDLHCKISHSSELLLTHYFTLMYSSILLMNTEVGRDGGGRGDRSDLCQISHYSRKLFD